MLLSLLLVSSQLKEEDLSLQGVSGYSPTPLCACKICFYEHLGLFCWSSVHKIVSISTSCHIQVKASSDDLAGPAAAASKSANAALSSALHVPPISDTGHKARRKRTKKSKASHKHLRQFTSSITVDGDTFAVGDNAYIRMTNDFDEDDFTEEEVCQVCGRVEPEDTPIMECNQCLQGYHITCLTPPLTSVPKVKKAYSLHTCCCCCLSQCHTTTCVLVCQHRLLNVITK